MRSEVPDDYKLCLQLDVDLTVERKKFGRSKSKAKQLVVEEPRSIQFRLYCHSGRISGHHYSDDEFDAEEQKACEEAGVIEPEKARKKKKQEEALTLPVASQDTLSRGRPAAFW